MNYREALINPEDLASKENELFDNWSANVDGFIRDGCADPDKYCSAPVKLLFVLKEVNGGHDWDLREFMKEGCRSQTWNVIARWIENIFNLDKNYVWNELSKDNDNRRKIMIPQVCAINLKKTPGSSVANSNKIAEAVSRDKIQLRKQFELYNPDITILCGTENHYQNIVDNNPKWEMTSRGIWYYIDADGMIVISFSHPKARTKECFFHYCLIDAIKEITSR